MSSSFCRAAVLDIGTQTFRMAGAEIRGSCISLLFSKRENVRLGEAMKQSGGISQEALRRAASALESFQKILKEYSISRVRAVGTAALRQAVNAGTFLDWARSLGFSVEIIHWQEEARLAAKGAAGALGMLETSWAMVDVGGGSSEIVFCNRDDVVSAVSLEAGAVSLLDMMPAGRSCDVKLLSETARRLVSEGLKKDFLHLGGLKQAVGTGGTATTAAAVETGLYVYDPRLVRGRIISRSALKQLLYRMCALDLEERRKVKGLEPERADIFPAGIAILAEIVSYLRLGEITISDGGLLSGLLIAFLEKECDFHVEPSCARSLYI